MSLANTRKDFPVLQRQIKGKPIIYLDNACVSLRPNCVIDALGKYYREYSACGDRSMHALGNEVTRQCDLARTAIAKFINAKQSSEIVFTRNTTEGINLIARSLRLKSKEVVLTSDKEHNSNLVPWLLLAQRSGIVHRVLSSKLDNTFNLDQFEANLNDEVKLVSLGYTSNLDGVTIPAKEIIQLAHQHNIKVLLDAAQTIAHQRIDVQELGVDFLVFSGHKMLGPSGIGVLYGQLEQLEQLEPFMVGGDTVEYTTYSGFALLPPPKRFEAGLQDYAGIIGLGEAANYLESLPVAEITKHEYTLNQYITEAISSIDKLHIIGPSDPSQRGSIVSFYVDGVDSHKIALMLNDTVNVMVRSGQHCVHSWFQAHNIQSSVRFSFAFYNTMAEAKLAVEQLQTIIKVLT